MRARVHMLGAFFAISLTVAAARGGVVVTRDGKPHEGQVRLDANGATVSFVPANTPNTRPMRLALSDLRAVLFETPVPGIVSGGQLRGGWVAVDVGTVNIAGSTRYADGVFTLNGGAGGDFDEADEAFHMTAQALPMEGQIVARVASIEGPATAMAGIMIHGLVPDDPRFQALMLGPEGVDFVVRQVAGQPVQVLHGARVKPPYWLKLIKLPGEVIACQSTDGHKWEQVGGVAWPQPVTMMVGLVTMSRRPFVPATAAFDHVQSVVHGLKADYFADTKFSDLKFTRIDPNVDANWGNEPPNHLLGADEFAVRWTGQLEAKYSEPTAFALQASTGARLFLDGQIILDTKAAHQRNGLVNLVAGQRYELRVDYYKAGGAGACRLSWASPSLKGEVIPHANLYFAGDGALVATTQPAADFIAPLTPSARGIFLRDGSIIPGNPVSSDGSNLTLRYRQQKDVVVRMDEVADIYFQPPAPKLALALRGKPSGVATARGDYLESEFQSLTEGKVHMNSALFGPSALDPIEIIAVNVHAPHDPPPVAKFRVRCDDGGVYMAESITPNLQLGTLVVQTSLAGALEFPVRELVAIEMP